MAASIDTVEYNDIEFHEKVGEGGFGAVKRVTFKKAYKGYKEAAAKSVFELGEKEVKIMSQLHHPNVVELLGFCHIAVADIILMEYASNGSLHDYLSNPLKPLPYELKKKWAQESALGIQHLHNHNFLHRDIKPQNCLLFQDNLLKLCDFGLAREIDRSQTTSSAKGTYRYMAPEIHKGNKQGRSIYSKPADIYAYGMLVLEICARKPPFDGMQWQTVVHQVGNGTKPTIPGDCPRDLSDLIQRCWNTDPKGRPTIEAIVAVVPEAPGTPDTIEIDATHMIITWIPPTSDGGSPITHYIIEKKEKKSSTWIKAHAKDVTERTLKVQGLDEGKEYEFRVAAINIAGQGPFSESSEPKLAKPPYVVPEAPGTPDTIEIDATHMTITWIPPTSDGGSPITHYIIEKKEKKSNTWIKAHAEDVTNRTLKVQGLDEGKEYEFRVAAINIAGQGPFSESSEPKLAKPPYALCEWLLEREIHPEYHGNSLQADHVACCPNGDMVISDRMKVHILGSDGQYKMSLTSSESNPDKQIGFVEGITVSPQGYVLVVDETKYVKVFDVKGKYLHCFSVLSAKDDPNCMPVCIAIDREGQVLVGNRLRNIITIHTCPDGKLVNKVKCSIGVSASMAVNSKNQILLHFDTLGSVYSKVVAIDYSGNEVFTFTPSIDEDVTGKEVLVRGIVCDADDNIYIAMNVWKVITTIIPNTGHIHKYSPTGAFLQCIAKGLHDPWELSITPDGSLVVANVISVLIYSLKYK